MKYGWFGTSLGCHSSNSMPITMWLCSCCCAVLNYVECRFLYIWCSNETEHNLIRNWFGIYLRVCICFPGLQMPNGNPGLSERIRFFFVVEAQYFFFFFFFVCFVFVCRHSKVIRGFPIIIIIRNRNQCWYWRCVHRLNDGTNPFVRPFK